MINNGWHIGFSTPSLHCSSSHVGRSSNGNSNILNFNVNKKIIMYLNVLCILICRLPFWPYMKLIFCLWLVLPIFNGAAYIYENFVRKYVKVGSYVGSNVPEGQRRVLQMMSLDARKSVERYIEKYGAEAFDRVVKAVRQLFSFVDMVSE